MNFIKKNWKGVLLCLVIAIPSWILGKIFPIVGGPVFGIILGMIITLPPGNGHYIIGQR